MAGVVVTVPKQLWAEWIAEGDLPGEDWSGSEFAFYIGGRVPFIGPGERVYVVAHGKLRGYAPLVRVRPGALIRAGNAVAVTINEPIPGFRGWRYRWWKREAERPFAEWKDVQPVGGLFGA